MPIVNAETLLAEVQAALQKEAALRFSVNGHSTAEGDLSILEPVFSGL